MSVLIVMDHRGDTRHYFDANDAQALAKAEERFKQLTGEGFIAAVRTGPGQVSKVGSFDRRRLVLIDLQPEEGIVGRSNLERAVRYLIPAIRDLAEVRKGGR